MDPEKREKVRRWAAIIVCLAALAISASAFYGIKRLQSDRTPHIHRIREVNKVMVDGKGRPLPPPK